MAPPPAAYGSSIELHLPDNAACSHHPLAAGGLFFALAFFAFTSLTTTDLLTAERRLVVREVRGEWLSCCCVTGARLLLPRLGCAAQFALLYSKGVGPRLGADLIGACSACVTTHLLCATSVLCAL